MVCCLNPDITQAGLCYSIYNAPKYELSRKLCDRKTQHQEMFPTNEIAITTFFIAIEL